MLKRPSGREICYHIKSNIFQKSTHHIFTAGNKWGQFTFECNERKIILMVFCCYMSAEDHALESVQETYAMVRKPSNVKGNWHWKDLTSFMLTTMFWEQLKCMLVLVLLGDFSDSDVIYFFFLIYISFKHTVCVSCCWYFELCFVDLREKKPTQETDRKICWWVPSVYQI